MNILKYYVFFILLFATQILWADGLVPLSDDEMVITTANSNISASLLIDLNQSAEEDNYLISDLVTREDSLISPDEDLNFANDQINQVDLEDGNWQLLETFRSTPEEASQVETMIQSLGANSGGIQDNIIQAGGLLGTE